MYCIKKGILRGSICINSSLHTKLKIMKSYLKFGAFRKLHSTNMFLWGKICSKTFWCTNRCKCKTKWIYIWCVYAHHTDWKKESLSSIKTPMEWEKRKQKNKKKKKALSKRTNERRKLNNGNVKKKSGGGGGGGSVAMRSKALTIPAYKRTANGKYLNFHEIILLAVANIYFSLRVANYSFSLNICAMMSQNKYSSRKWKKHLLLRIHTISAIQQLSSCSTLLTMCNACKKKSASIVTCACERTYYFVSVSVCVFVDLVVVIAVVSTFCGCFISLTQWN